MGEEREWRSSSVVSVVGVGRALWFVVTSCVAVVVDEAVVYTVVWVVLYLRAQKDQLCPMKERAKMSNIFLNEHPPPPSSSYVEGGGGVVIVESGVSLRRQRYVSRSRRSVARSVTPAVPLPYPKGSSTADNLSYPSTSGSSVDGLGEREGRKREEEGSEGREKVCEGVVQGWCDSGVCEVFVRSVRPCQ